MKKGEKRRERNRSEKERKITRKKQISVGRRGRKKEKGRQS